MGKLIKWEITKRCNLNCLHCGIEKNLAARELNFKEATNIIDKLVDGDVERINLYGGEPFIRKDIFDIIRYGVKSGLSLGASTNGTLLEIEKIKKLCDTGINSLLISIDGSTKESHDALRGDGTFDITVKNLENLKEYITIHGYSIRLSINIVLNKFNYSEIERIIYFCLRLRVNQCNFSNIEFEGCAIRQKEILNLTTKESIEAKKRILEYVENNKPFPNHFEIGSYGITPLVREHLLGKNNCRFEGNRCNASLSEGFIDSEGNLFPCDKKEFFKGTNLVNNNFYQAWNSSDFIRMFQIMNDRKIYKNYFPCTYCKYFFIGNCKPCPLLSFVQKKEIIFDECAYVYKNQSR